MDGYGFRVDAEAVSQLGMLVDRQGQRAMEHLNQDLVVKGTLDEAREGILFTVWPALDRWQELARTNTSRGMELATKGGYGFQQAAMLYRKLDTVQAGLLDDTYEPATSCLRPLDDGMTHQPPGHAFDDLMEQCRPDSATAEVRRELATLAHNIVTEGERIMGLVSYFGQYRQLIKDVVGFDPYEEIGKVVVGDWEALGRDAIGLANTSDGFDAIKANLDQGRFEIQELWTGNAAGQAQEWLAGYSCACGQHAEFLRRASEEVLHFTRGVYHRYAALSSAIDTAVDTFMDAVLKAPLTPVFGEAIALLRGENRLEIWGSLFLAFSKISEVVGQIMMLAHSFAGITETVAGMGEAATASWPPEPYDHPN
jgi:hypothetical protein